MGRAAPSTGLRSAAIAGWLVLLPFLVAWPVLAQWRAGGIDNNSWTPWLWSSLAVSWLLGCAGWVLVRVRLSTRLLILLIYAPVLALALFAWSYLWCPLCDF